MTPIKMSKDISKLTSIPLVSVEKFLTLEENCICYDVLDNLKSGETTSLIDLGFGMLSIIIINDEMHFKFVPSKSLEDKLKKALSSGKLDIISLLEDKINSKLLIAYKELIQ